MQYRHFPAPRLWRLLCLAAAACGLAACGNLNSIHRTLDTASGTGALIDAKQRAIIVSQRSDEVLQREVVTEPVKAAADGGAKNGMPATPGAGDKASVATAAVTTREWGSEKRYVACAEPSPDAMSAYAAQFAGELAMSPQGADGTNRSAAIKGALQEAAAFIGMRTPSIQLLRDAMYRVCEAYANGAIDSDQYELLMRRYQRQIVAMMAIESLTQAGRVPAITLTTQGSTGGERALSEWMGEIKNQQELSDKQQKVAEDKGTESGNLTKEIGDLEKELKQDGLKDEQKTAIQQKIGAAKSKKLQADAAKQAAEADMRRANARIASLQDHMAGGASLTGRTAADVASATATTSAQIIAAAAPTVQHIANQVLDVDDTAALCFIHYKRPEKNPQDSALRGLCDTHMTYMKAVRDLRTQVLAACVKRAGSDADKLGQCAGILASEPKGDPGAARTTNTPTGAKTMGNDNLFK